MYFVLWQKAFIKHLQDQHIPDYDSTGGFLSPSTTLLCRNYAMEILYTPLHSLIVGEGLKVAKEIVG